MTEASVSICSKAGKAAQEAEDAGYSGIWTAETSHDPFFPLLLAAEHTENIELGTSIAVAFARNPMLLANVGYDLQAYSEGRFILGLGSQIKPHIDEALLHAMEPPRGTDARDDPRDPCDLGVLGQRHQARLPRRVLHAHADDAVLQSGSEPERRRRASSSPASAQ